MISFEYHLANQLSYVIYLVVSIGLTAWVARTLSSSGEVFLVRCFGQDDDLAKSTNRLLVIGFYLVNLGFICFRLEGWQHEPLEVLPAVGSRIGVSLLFLGAMHFFNMMMIARMGRTVSAWIRQTERDAIDVRAVMPPPVVPHRPHG